MHGTVPCGAVPVRVPRPSAICSAFAAASICLGMSACQPAEIVGDRGVGSFQAGTCVLPAVTPMADRISLRRTARLGFNTEEGTFLVESPTMGNIVRDHRGRYWIGQAEEMKVFGPTGAFLTAVGRGGDGPLEFRRAMPIHVDANGGVHVLDPLNMRISRIDDDLILIDEQRLPGFTWDAAPIKDGIAYAIAAWIPTADRIGLPLHVLGTRDVSASFGKNPARRTQEPIDQSSIELALSTDSSSGLVFTIPQWEYKIEAWRSSGQLAGTVEGPNLDDGRRGPAGSWSFDNPPWNGIVDIKHDAMGLLWVIVRARATDWHQHATEMILPDGAVVLDWPDNDRTLIYRSRLDVIEPETCAIKASQWFDGQGLLLGFVDGAPPMAVSELVYEGGFIPIINIWQTDFAPLEQ